MNIGIDVDGVLVDLETKMLTYGTKFSVENNLNKIGRASCRERV